MTLVFWQNIISIHQQTFLEAVAAEAGVGKVVLVAEHAISGYRKDMGWEVPEIAGVAVIVSPSLQQVSDLVIQHKDAVHIMGGIKVGAMLSAAFSACIGAGCRLGIMTEPYDDAGPKGLLRRLKYSYYRWKYKNYIDFVLAIGRQGVKQYTGLGFNENRVFPWAYFISIPLAQRVPGVNGLQRIIYAGRLEQGKGIYKFAEELVKTGNRNYILDMYGAGADEVQLRQLIAARGLQENMHIYPFLPHGELLAKYGAYDWVVLPSAAKDGWGVIVSEGLLNGLKAMCSSICGVSWAVHNGANGMVFDWSIEGSCSNAIAAMFAADGFAVNGAISSRSKATLSAEAGATYFMQIMGSVYDNKKKPPIPWE